MLELKIKRYTFTETSIICLRTVAKYTRIEATKAQKTKKKKLCEADFPIITAIINHGKEILKFCIQPNRKIRNLDFCKHTRRKIIYN